MPSSFFQCEIVERMINLQNYKMVIAYDGRKYMGYRVIKGNIDKSIQGKLESILHKLYEEEVEVVSAVNTDASVHAKKQVVNFKTPDNRLNAKELFEYIEKYLPDDIIVLSLEKADERFQSKLLAKSISYEYRLWKQDAKYRPLFERHLVNLMDKKLDVKKMEYAAKIIEGEHDFAAFSTRTKLKNSVKKVIEIKIKETENEVIITIKANGFVLSMERIIVGTLIQVGFGERDAKTIENAFTSKDSKYVGHKAMASALTLVDVEY